MSAVWASPGTLGLATFESTSVSGPPILYQLAASVPLSLSLPLVSACRSVWPPVRAPVCLRLPWLSPAGPHLVASALSAAAFASFFLFLGQLLLSSSAAPKRLCSLPLAGLLGASLRLDSPFGLDLCVACRDPRRLRTLLRAARSAHDRCGLLGVGVVVGWGQDPAAWGRGLGVQRLARSARGAWPEAPGAGHGVVAKLGATPPGAGRNLRRGSSLAPPRLYAPRPPCSPGVLAVPRAPPRPPGFPELHPSSFLTHPLPPEPHSLGPTHAASPRDPGVRAPSTPLSGQARA